jgi:hypothetical protein
LQPYKLDGSYNSKVTTIDRGEYTHKRKTRPQNTRIKITITLFHRMTRIAQNDARISLECHVCVVAEYGTDQ